MVFFLLTIFHHFDVFYEVMNNHLTYNPHNNDRLELNTVELKQNKKKKN